LPVQQGVSIVRDVMPNSWWFRLAVLIMLAARSPIARADTTVSVLGVRSLDGDDAMARKASVGLRTAAQKLPEVKVSERNVNLTQLALAHGCEDADAACLSAIAKTLDAARLIFGEMEQGLGEVQVRLTTFDASAGVFDARAERSFAPAELADGKLGPSLVSLLHELMDNRTLGSVLVAGDLPGATVSADGEVAGNLDERGELTLRKVRAGEHAIAVEAADGTRREHVVLVRAGQRTTLRIVLGAPHTAAAEPMAEITAEPTPPAPLQMHTRDLDPSPKRDAAPRARTIAAWSGVALSAAFLGGAVYTWLAIDGINEDKQMIRYRELDAQVRAPATVGNVCTDAEDGYVASRYPANGEYVGLEAHARSNCARIDRLNPLQYVFLTGSVAAAGVAGYLFLTRPKKARSLEHVQLHPQLGREHGYLGASVRF
jgi:hypothetical protein